MYINIYVTINECIIIDNYQFHFYLSIKSYLLEFYIATSH